MPARILLSVFLLCQCLIAPAFAQTAFHITTLAGNGEAGYSGDGEAATAAALNLPAAVARDSQGNLYIAERYNHRVRKVSAEGAISTVAGNGEEGYAGDGGPATAARLTLPSGVAVDASGNLYIADSGNHVVRQVNPEGVITTLAGTGEAGFSGDRGGAASARLNEPTALALDGQGNLLIADRLNHRIRWVKLKPGNPINTLAGTGKNRFEGDGGPAYQASLNQPWDVTVDSLGRVYIADAGNHRVRRIEQIDRDAAIQTVAGSAFNGYGGDANDARAAKLGHPQGVAVDIQGNLFIADTYNHRIRQVTPEGIIYTVAGSSFTELPNGGFEGDDGPASVARLNAPQDVIVDDQGRLYLADARNHRVRRLEPWAETRPFSTIETLAGRGSSGLRGGGFSGDGQAAKTARLKIPAGLALDDRGRVFIADSGNHRVRRIDADGVISSVAGGDEAGYTGDGGLARAAKLNKPTAVALDQAGNLYLADSGNHVVRRVDERGLIETIAGTGEAGYRSGLGNARSARFNSPEDLALDAEGRIYIADTGNHCVRRVDALGNIETLAGICGSGQFRGGYGGDGGLATSARLNSPSGVAVDSLGNVYIADRNNNRVRRVSPQGIIETVAGNGQAGYSGDGWLASAAMIYYPYDVTLDGAGNLYIAEFYTDRVRKVDPRGILSTVAGNGAPAFGGDGWLATAAQLYAPSGLAVNAMGSRIYIADTYNHRLRRVSAPTHELRVEIEGMGRVSGPAGGEQGIDCGQDCRETYLAGSLVQLQAVPGAGGEFKGWEGDCDAEGGITLNRDSTCLARFAGPSLQIPTLAVNDCGGGVQQPASLDLNAEYQGQVLMDWINQIPDISRNGWYLRLSPAGLLRLELSGLRFTVQPVAVTLEDQPEGTRVDPQQNVYFVTESGLTVIARPAVKDACALRRALGRLGLARFSVAETGNLSIPLAPGLRLGLRPDWASVPVADNTETGLFLTRSPLSEDTALASWVFVDEDGERWRQFFYPALAQPGVLEAQTERFSFGPFGQISFDWRGEHYRGMPAYFIGHGAAGETGELQISAEPDVNGDGRADFRVIYPNGESQAVFALGDENQD